MRAEIILTVSESKRLIARGVAQLNIVKQALQEGIVVVTSGSTNGFVAEEILGEKMDKTGYMTGKTLPATLKAEELNIGEPIKDLVFRDGQLDPEFDRLTGAQAMKAGDVYIKGANALNYKEQVAGILIGHPAAGTIGGAIGHIIGKRANLVIPVGLEKCTAHNIYDLEQKLNQKADVQGSVPKMIAVRGTIITEIEAVEVLFRLKAWHIASGGLAGAEGGVRLLVEGTSDEIQRMQSVLDEIYGEPPFYG